jgi:hypothetical protein
MPYLRAVVLVLVVSAIAVVADPAHRGTTFRAALVALALIGFVALARLAARRLPPAASSPFDPVPVAAPKAIVPVEVRRLTSDLTIYQQGRGARLGSGAADRVVRGVVRDRLARHHGVAAGEEPLLDPAAARLLGPVTRACLARRGTIDPEAIDPEALVAELEAL